MEPFLYLVDFVLKLYMLWERFSKRYLRADTGMASQILYAEILSCDITTEVRDFYRGDSTLSCDSLSDYLDWCHPGESPVTIVFRLDREIRVCVINLEASRELTTDSRVLFSNLELDSLYGSSLSLFDLDWEAPRSRPETLSAMGACTASTCAGQRAETFLDSEISRTQALLRRLKSQ